MFICKRNIIKGPARTCFRGGFTLVELLVTISIFVILTGVVLFNQSKFNSTILLKNLAYDTALTIRQAQTYGINIKEFNTGAVGAQDQFVPYGVHFDKNQADKSFILFADTKFDLTNPTALTVFTGAVGACNPSEGCVNRYSIKRGNYISGLCVEDSSGCSSVNTLDIIFRRPNPDAKIFGDGEDDKTGAVITLMGADNTSTTSVRVQANGLIEIK